MVASLYLPTVEKKVQFFFIFINGLAGGELTADYFFPVLRKSQFLNQK